MHKLRRVDPNEQKVSALAGGSIAATAATGAGASAAAEDTPDLASSLAAALSRRKGDMGDSDEEAESDGEWD